MKTPPAGPDAATQRHPRRLVRRIVVIAACAVVLGACTATVSPSSDRAVGGDPSQSTVVTQSPKVSALTWKPCHDQFQCATLRVPLNWFATADNAPSSDKTISIAVVKQPATDADPIGSLIMNPGGPGESGVEFLTQFSSIGQIPDEMAAKFDLVSWDPRGTGDSSPLKCTTVAQSLEPQPLPLPPKGAKRDAVANTITKRIEKCLHDNADLIPYVGTRQTAEDLNALVTALGDDKLTYLGFSYGTAIGLEYLQAHPDRVRAMVLDGLVMPGEEPISSSRNQIASFESNLDRFLEQCANDTTCDFGNGKPRAQLTKLLDKLRTGARIPADYQLPDESGKTHKRTGTLGYSEALQGLILPLYSRENWPLLAMALRDATNATKPDGGYLLMFRDQMLGRQLDGSWSNSSDAFSAIQCADQTERATSPFGDLSVVAEWSKEFPFLGTVGAVGLPGCYKMPPARWPAKMPTKATLKASPPVLLVNATHDSATPYRTAQQVEKLLPTSSLITVESENHTSVAQGNACVDRRAVQYLVQAELPASATCDADGN